MLPNTPRVQLVVALLLVGVCGTVFRQNRVGSDTPFHLHLDFFDEKLDQRHKVAGYLQHTYALDESCDVYPLADPVLGSSLFSEGPEFLRVYRQRWKRCLGRGQLVPIPKKIMQHHDLPIEALPFTNDWAVKNPTYHYELINSPGANRLVNATTGPDWRDVWYSKLPYLILRADAFRYLWLFVTGGIYSDTDTQCLKPASEWLNSIGSQMRYWDEETKSIVQTPPSLDAGIRLVVGVEVDGTSEDWSYWWARRITFIQWTIASAAGHPVLYDTLRRVTIISNELARRKAAAEAEIEAEKAWLAKLTQDHSDDGGWHPHNEEQLVSGYLGKGQQTWEARTFTSRKPSDPRGGVAVLDWTGPGVFTDAVFSYLEAMYGLPYKHVKGLKHPLQVGDVLILPPTGFSPEHHQGGPISSPLALVKHNFTSSWLQPGDYEYT